MGQLPRRCGRGKGNNRLSIQEDDRNGKGNTRRAWENWKGNQWRKEATPGMEIEVFRRKIPNRELIRQTNPGIWTEKQLKPVLNNCSVALMFCDLAKQRKLYNSNSFVIKPVRVVQHSGFLDIFVYISFILDSFWNCMTLCFLALVLHQDSFAYTPRHVREHFL
jgi:hypothetical protein